jgi:hypothetical protein
MGFADGRGFGSAIRKELKHEVHKAHKEKRKWALRAQ